MVSIKHILNAATRRPVWRRPVWRMARPAYAALIVAGLGLGGGLTSLHASSAVGSSGELSQTGGLKIGADGRIVPFCLANSQAPAMRLWISQHPKSRRGRLDHRRVLTKLVE
jgi:hypothetical protein